MGARWITTGLTGCLIALSASSAVAQEESSPELNWYQRMIVNRMADRLGLTAEQKSQVESIIRDTEAKKKKLDAEQNDRIKALLSADQKEQFDELQRSLTRRGRGGRSGRSGAQEDPKNSPQMKELTKLLELDDVQQEKIAEIGRKAMERGRKRGQEIWQQIQRGEFDFSKIEEEFSKFFNDFKTEVHPLLTSAQRPKFDKWVGGLQEQMADPSQWGRLAERFGGGRGRRNRGGERWSGSGGGSTSLGRVLRDLDLSEDERLILEPSIKRILELDRSWRRTQRNHARRLRSLASDAEVEGVRAALAAAREARSNYTKERGEAEAELRDLVTLSQEAMLVSHGVLR